MQFSPSDRIWRRLVQGKEILCIDYSGLREGEMMQLGTAATEALLACAHPQLVLTCYRDTFTTPAYVRHMERLAPQVKHLIERNALVGLNTAKMMILKGFNLVAGTDFRPFASERDALCYLLNEPLQATGQPIFGQRISG
jgi:hypothetical protein